jgi:tetratricopeptide (TPR) repeat protein
MKRCLAGMLLLALFLIGCSSVPKDEEPQKASDVKNQAADYAGFGDLYYGRAQYDQALKFFELSLQENISVNNEEGIIKSHNSIGKVYAAQGDSDLAMNHFNQAYRLAKKHQEPMLLSQCENNIGEMYLRRDQSGDALSLFTKAVKRLDGLDFEKLKKDDDTIKDHRPVLYHNSGVAYKQQKNYSEALQWLQLALELNTEANLYKDMADNYYVIASVYSKQNQFEQAVEHASLALDYDKLAENKPGIAKDFLALGLISWKAGLKEEGYAFFSESYFVYKTLGLQEEMKKLLVLLIDSARQLGYNEDQKTFAELLRALEE